MKVNNTDSSLLILFSSVLLVDCDEEVGSTADGGEAAIDFYIDIFHFVLGIVEMHGGTDVVEVATVLEAIFQYQADGTGAAGDASAAKA